MCVNGIGCSGSVGMEGVEVAKVNEFKYLRSTAQMTEGAGLK